ncbi:hypothetical protein C8Q75DRAFT_517421 [Abortiporus biennis]|nr:hypothetical protein C8Q75DRAFT_517421 [Abortiporus biennis]
MVNWHDANVQLICATIFARLLAVMHGVYGWYFITTLWQVEIPLLRRKLKFNLSLIPYLLGRYLALASVTTGNLSTEGSPFHSCVGLDKAFVVFTNTSVSCASTNFLLRPLALWKSNPFALAILIASWLGHWGTCLYATITAASLTFGGNRSTCGGNGAPSAPSAQRAFIVFYTYTLVFDTLILISTIAGLQFRVAARSSYLWTATYNQGIWYLLVTWALNIPIVVFCWLNLNSIMNIMFAIPSAAISVITSSMAVTSFIGMREDESTIQDIPLQAEGQLTTLYPLGFLVTSSICIHPSLSPANAIITDSDTHEDTNSCTISDTRATVDNVDLSKHNENGIGDSSTFNTVDVATHWEDCIQ